MPPSKKNEDEEDEAYMIMEPRRSCQDPSMNRRLSPPVYYHIENDLTTTFGFGFHPKDAFAKKGPGVNADIERQFTTCRLLSEFTYTNWTESIMPLSDSNLAEGLSEAVVMIANVAANGTNGLKHDDLYLTVQFLSTLRADNGEIPPNILGFIEHVDYQTLYDGTEITPYVTALLEAYRKEDGKRQMPLLYEIPSGIIRSAAFKSASKRLPTIRVPNRHTNSRTNSKTTPQNPSI